MGGRPDDEGQATTLAAVATAPSERRSKPVISTLREGDAIGRYQLVARIGAGAMGVVWSAHDPQLDRRVAIKLVHPNLARSPEAAARLLREARAMAKLSHRSVVTVHDAGDVEGQLFLAMELVEGTNLGAMVRERGPQELADWHRWLDLVLDAGRGLAAAHRSGVLHRDFKPDNVLVDAAGRVCVGDFGLATLGEESYAAATQRWEPGRPFDLTTTGALLGTPAYMGPQQLRGLTIDARADQFAYCVTAWELLYGERPFTVTGTGLEAIPELLDKLEAGPPETPAGTRVPPAVCAVLRRGLAADPDERWPDMDTLIANLESAGRRPPSQAHVARSRAHLYIGIAVLSLSTAAVAVVFAVRGRDTSAVHAPAAQPSPAPAPAPTADAKRLFNVPMRTGMAISKDGKRIALGSNRLEVRSLDSSEIWNTALPSGSDVAYLELDGDALRFAMHGGTAVGLWHYTKGPEIELAGDLSGRWYGRTALGDLVYRDTESQLYVVDGKRDVTHWSVAHGIDVAAVSPNGNRVAWLEPTRFAGRILVRDLDTGTQVASPVLDAPTALAWLDDRALAYATGTLERPRILRSEITGAGFSAPTELYGSDVGWYGGLRAHDGTLYVVEMHPTTRARVIERAKDGRAAHDLDNATAGAALAWIDDTEFLTWNRDTHRLDRRRGENVDVTKLSVDGEPANATIAGDTLITALRGNQGRRVVAVSLTDGRAIWRHDDKQTLAVRCASDRHPPCFAIRSTDGKEHLVTLDPRTGELGTTPLFSGKFEDVAVSDDGKHLLISSNGLDVSELDTAGKVLATYATALTNVRSLAFDPRGGILVGGTLARNNYQVGRVGAVGAKFEVLSQADDDILSLVRPSRDGSRILVLARSFTPEVWRIRPAAR